MMAGWIRRVKFAALTMTAGMLLGTGCGLTDIRDNMVAGGLGFVKSMTTDVLDLVVPNLDELFPAIPAE